MGEENGVQLTNRTGVHALTKTIQFFLHRAGGDGGDNLRGGKKQQQEAWCLCCRHLLLLAAAFLLIHCKSGSQTRGLANREEGEEEEEKQIMDTNWNSSAGKFYFFLSGFSGFPFLSVSCFRPTWAFLLNDCQKLPLVWEDTFVLHCKLKNKSVVGGGWASHYTTI